MNSKILILLILLALTLTACQFAPAAQSGDVLFEDDFSTRANRWTSLANEGGVMNYDGGGFRMVVSAQGRDYWATPGLNFDDVRIDVDTIKVAGPVENRIGVVCRHRDVQNFYFFVISTDGYYAIGKVKEGEQSLIGQKEMLYSSAIETGLAINHLRVECQGSILRLYINDAPTALVDDFDFPEGDVGLLAGTFDEAGLDVLFDNFVVIKP